MKKINRSIRGNQEKVWARSYSACSCRRCMHILPVMFEHVILAGLGLIGTSMLYDLRSHKLAGRITGIDLDKATGMRLSDQGLLDDFYAAPPVSSFPLASCDCLILAVPPQALAEMTQALVHFLSPDALVMDVASIKRGAIAHIAPHLPEQAHFIPCHPVAGGEGSGSAAARAGLFLHRRVILTPEAEANAKAVATTVSMWETFGAKCEPMPADAHDFIYAHMSHLPHLVAFATALAFYDTGVPVPPSLQTFMRISASPVSLWCDICLSNADMLLSPLYMYHELLGKIRDELSSQEAPPMTHDKKTPPFALAARIVASALISTVAASEKHFSHKMARYAGPGFIDLTSILQQPPEEDMAEISSRSREVALLLDAIGVRLAVILQALEDEDGKALKKVLTV